MAVKRHNGQVSATGLSQGEFESISESSWIPFEVTADYVRSYAMVDLNGTQVRAERTQYLADELIQKANKQEYDESDGKRWNDGRVAARVPLNVLFNGELGMHLKRNDHDGVKHWLNAEENKKWRTFKGTV